jgi:hypothetical protein
MPVYSHSRLATFGTRWRHYKSILIYHEELIDDKKRIETTMNEKN